MNPARRTVAVGHRTDPGPRETNQDGVRDVLLPDGRWLLAVADGMGGLEAGDVASRLALDVLEQRVVAGSALGQAVRSANAALHQRAGDERMGTTMIAAAVDASGVRLANVGDSRAYYVDSLGVTQITTDHTVAAEAAQTGTHAEADVASTPWGGTLTRALGMHATVEVDEFGPFPLGEGSWLILCTDGVYRVLSDGEMEECVREGGEPRSVASRLVEMALDKGTEDNATAGVVSLFGTKRPGASGDEDPEIPTPWDPTRFLREETRLKRPRYVTRGVVFLSMVVFIGLVVWAIFFR
jgi:protein phosphatase